MATVMGGVGYGLYFVAKVGALNSLSFQLLTESAIHFASHRTADPTAIGTGQAKYR